MFLSKVGLGIWKAISFPWTLHQWLTKGFVTGTLPLLDTIGLIIAEISLFCFCSFCLGLFLRVIGPVSDCTDDNGDIVGDICSGGYFLFVDGFSLQAIKYFGKNRVDVGFGCMRGVSVFNDSYDGV